MKLNDFIILGKKILVGVIVYLIPLVLITGGLLLTNQILKKENTVQYSPNKRIIKK